MASAVSLKCSQVKVEACPCPCRVALLNLHAIYTLKIEADEIASRTEGTLYIICQMSGRGS